MNLLNLHYFAGTISSIRDSIIETQGFKLWEKALEPEGLKDYIMSTSYDYGIENNALFLPD
jgi:hypothetical protein